MTRDEFLTALQACAPQFQWYLDTLDNVRAIDDNPARAMPHCPLSAVAEALTQQGEKLDCGMPYAAAALLGIDADTRLEIVSAADDCFCDSGLLRQALMQAVGLEEAP